MYFNVPFINYEENKRNLEIPRTIRVSEYRSDLATSLTVQ